MTWLCLHRAVFSGPFHIALLLSDLGDDDLACDVFGWRYGMVMHRGYYLTGVAASDRDDLREAAPERSYESEPSGPGYGALETGAVCDTEGCDRSEQTRQRLSAR
jgi:hypothetical protein